MSQSRRPPGSTPALLNRVLALVNRPTGQNECGNDPVSAVVGDVPACPTCGRCVKPAGPVEGGARCIDDPALTVPAQRLLALAAEVGITVRSVPPEHGRRFGAAVALLPVPEDEPDTCVWIADDLTGDLYADVLAFAIALTSETDLILATVDGILGVGRDRLPPADGVGHAAWHILRACGRGAPSTTFAVEQIRVA